MIFRNGEITGKNGDLKRYAFGARVRPRLYKIHIVSFFKSYYIKDFICFILLRSLRAVEIELEIVRGSQAAHLKEKKSRIRREGKFL